MTNRAGRPSKKSEAICDEILTRLAEGEPLAQICRDAHMPSWRTVYDWLEQDTEFFAGFSRARAHGYDVIANDCLTIADDSMRDWRITEQGLRPDTEVIGRAKLRVETRLKLLAKWDPKRYGERQAIDLGGELGVKKTSDPGALASEIGQLLADPEVQRLLKGQ